MVRKREASRLGEGFQEEGDLAERVSVRRCLNEPIGYRLDWFGMV